MKNPLYKPRPACWPQFGLRTLFLLVTIGGVVFGWFGVQFKWIRDRREARLADTTPQHYPGFAYAPWSLHYLAETGESDMYYWEGDEVTAERLRRLFPEATVTPHPRPDPGPTYGSYK
jgi:hypothetical protein